MKSLFFFWNNSHVLKILCHSTFLIRSIAHKNFVPNPLYSRIYIFILLLCHFSLFSLSLSRNVSLSNAAQQQQQKQHFFFLTPRCVCILTTVNKGTFHFNQQLNNAQINKSFCDSFSISFHFHGEDTMETMVFVRSQKTGE